jgi:hypothetical protein
VTKRLVATLALALVLLGCTAPNRVPTRAQVPLLTDPNPQPTCFLAWGGGLLIAHPEYGTAVGSPDTLVGAMPIAWPYGYTARWAGSELEVLHPDGQVAATTGRRYHVTGGGVSRDSMPGWDSLPEDGAFLACSVTALEELGPEWQPDG